MSRYVDLLRFPAPLVSDGGGGYSAAPPEDERITTGILCVNQDGASATSGSAVSDHVFENHHYQIELAVVARDVDSRTYVMEFKFDGRYRFPPDFWSDMLLRPPTLIEA
jgi:hypothetical protein